MNLERLCTLLALPGVAGDEGAVADWLEREIRPLPDVTLTRIGDDLIAVRGKPRTAVFAHTDTVGFTLGYEGRLIPIGGPSPREGDLLRCVSDADLRGKLRRNEDGKPCLRRVRRGDRKVKAEPGSRWIYGAEPKVREKPGKLTSPYLDNRAGVWSALNTLERCDNSAVAFTTGEEQHGHGARVCADWLHAQHGLIQALIADITWHTKHTPCGKGVVVSLRDAFCPRQAFLERVLALALESGIAFQREIQDSGSSDGGHLLRSSVPMDWVFVGAPEKNPHTARETVALSDLEAMTDLLIYLSDHL